MIHPPDCACDAYACQLRQKGVQIDTRATPSRRKLTFRPTKEWDWAKGRVGERRDDGSFSPYLSPGTLKPMGVYEYQHRRSNTEKQLRVLKSDPNVFRSERESSP